jgi:putative transposase
LVDTQGLLIKAFVTSASLSDQEGFFGILDSWKNPRRKVKLIWLDAGYQDAFGYAKQYGINIQVIKRTDKQFKVLPRRWVVERTFAWIGRYRRLSKDYEYRTSSSESFIYLSMSRLMLARMEIL